MDVGFTRTYKLEKNLYINLTNRCTNHCDFCVRNQPKGIHEVLDLWLDREPSAQEIIEDFQQYDFLEFHEIVFCGYGEPLLKLEEIIEVSQFIRSQSSIPIRINTNGQANLYFGKDITPKLKGMIDICSISLNASNPVDYEKHCRSDFKEDAFEGIIDFAKKCKAYVPKVLFTVVDVLEKEEIEECRMIAKNAGVGFRVRALIS
jgi:TatD family-associated radical SAM protein